jgi:hypothetical protein
MKTGWRARGAAVARTGWAAAAARSSTASSWRASSSDGRSRCHGDATDTGSESSSQR